MSIPNRLSEPRSFLAAAFMFGLFFGTLMWLWFSLMSVVLDGHTFGASVASGRVLGQAAFCAVWFGLFAGAMFRGETRHVQVHQPESFMARANIAAAELGYQPTFVVPNMLTLRPSWQAGRLAGNILVQLLEHEAVVVGPRLYVGRLASRLERAS